MGYFDAHVHTSHSDGEYSADEVIKMAVDKGDIQHIAITDHNKLLPNLDHLRKKYPSIEIISGSEISAEYYTSEGEKKEIHIIGIFLEHTDELTRFLAKNTPNIKLRFESMLEKLRECGVDLGYNTFEGFRNNYYPERENLGRPQLAAIIASKGYASSEEEAMDIYIGDFGERRAYVPNPHHFADMESVIKNIHKATGVAILAHPLSYNLSTDKVVALIKTFKSLNGDALEVFYSRYDEEKRQLLAWLATKHKLYFSCASDFHGTRITDRLDNHFSTVYLDKLREIHNKYKSKHI